MAMAYVDPKMKPRLDALSPELREAVLARGLPIRTLHDLIGVLDPLLRQQEG